MMSVKKRSMPTLVFILQDVSLLLNYLNQTTAQQVTWE